MACYHLITSKKPDQRDHRHLLFQLWHWVFCMGDPTNYPIFWIQNKTDEALQNKILLLRSYSTFWTKQFLRGQAPLRHWCLCAQKDRGCTVKISCQFYLTKFCTICCCCCQGNEFISMSATWLSQLAFQGGSSIYIYTRYWRGVRGGVGRVEVLLWIMQHKVMVMVHQEHLYVLSSKTPDESSLMED